jgi:futalosine hydrolase
VKKLLVVVATAQERDALVRSVGCSVADIGPYRAATTAQADVLVSGIGPAAAAACTATALALGRYDAVLSIGICGAFRGTADVGDLVVATELVAADLGADSPGGFLGMGSLDWADDVQPVDPAVLRAVVRQLGEVVTGPVLTVSTVTGTRVRANQLAERHGPVAEAMEGWGVLEAARAWGVPVLEVRAVSNLVGDRDSDAWVIPLAFAGLTRIGTCLLEDPWL